MSSEQIKEVIKKGGPFLGLSLLQVPFLFNNQFQGNEVVFIASLLFGIANSVEGYNEYRYTNIPEYSEYISLYKEFVSDIASMYSELGFKGDFATSLAYEFCIHNGIFSKCDVNRKWNQEEENVLVKYCGGRVTTGNFCCRHSASLLTDILSEMGGVATNISVRTSTDRIRDDANHLVTGLLCDNKRLVVDSMNYGEIFLIDDKDGRNIRTISSADGKIYRFIASDFFSESDNKKRFRNFMKYDSFDDFSEILQIESDAMREARKYFDEYKSFHEDEKPKILQLSRLSDTISFYAKK